jgi:uncharacterized membrane protein YheB (UPF0754 family)
MTKSLITTLLAAALVAVGLILDTPWQNTVLQAGLFALAGSVTNWLAIFMLFEKIPGLYGSGVIAARFEQFKSGIHALVMEQFFTEANLARFFDTVSDAEQHVDFKPIIEQTNLEPAYDGLVATIMESSFGSMLGMFGGQAALDPLKQPFIEKMRKALDEMAHSASFQASLKAKLTSMPVTENIHQQIELLVKARLDELTPLMVKQIVQTMIREHLGWLVVWGGVFGGLIGVAASFIQL